MHKVSLSSSCSSHKRKRLSSVKKTTAVLKKAMTEKVIGGKAASGMAPRKPGGSNPREAAGDKAPWTPGSTRNEKWKEVSAEYEALNAQ